jgi:hypothetical protein
MGWSTPVDSVVAPNIDLKGKKWQLISAAHRGWASPPGA